MSLRGELIELRRASAGDVDELAAIRVEPDVYDRWRGDDVVAETLDDIASDDVHLYVVELDGTTVGAVQWYESEDPDYRHAGIDIYLTSTAHGKGIGTDVVRTMARHLFADHGHHRLVIDPAADNVPAIAAYTKVGFRQVGLMRQYERGLDGTWHDGVLMELLADDFTG